VFDRPDALVDTEFLSNDRRYMRTGNGLAWLFREVKRQPKGVGVFSRPRSAEHLSPAVMLRARKAEPPTAVWTWGRYVGSWSCALAVRAPYPLRASTCRFPRRWSPARASESVVLLVSSSTITYRSAACEACSPVHASITFVKAEPVHATGPGEGLGLFRHLRATMRYMA